MRLFALFLLFTRLYFFFTTRSTLPHYSHCRLLDSVSGKVAYYLSSVSRTCMYICCCCSCYLCGSITACYCGTEDCGSSHPGAVDAVAASLLFQPTTLFPLPLCDYCFFFPRATLPHTTLSIPFLPLCAAPALRVAGVLLKASRPDPTLDLCPARGTQSVTGSLLPGIE